MYSQVKIAQVRKTDLKVNFFRREVLREQGVPETLLYETVPYERHIHGYGYSIDSYRFSSEKWRDTQFDWLYGADLDGHLGSLCGFKRYFSNRYVRAGMHYYTLTRYRASLISILWREGGFLDTIMPTLSGYEGVFFSIHAHNDRLRAIHRSMLTERRHQLGNKAAGVKYLDSFMSLPGMYSINGVQQHVYYFDLCGSGSGEFERCLSEEGIRNVD